MAKKDVEVPGHLLKIIQEAKSQPDSSKGTKGKGKGK